MTPRRQANHHQFHALNDDLSSSTTTNHKNKSYGGGGCGGGGSTSHCGSSNGINIVGGSTYNCDGMLGASSTSTGAHHQKQSTSASSHSHPKSLHRSFSQQEQQPKLDDRCGLRHRWQACPELHKAMDGVNYIADHTRKEEESTKVSIHLSSFSIPVHFTSAWIKQSKGKKQRWNEESKFVNHLWQMKCDKSEALWQLSINILIFIISTFFPPTYEEGWA